MHPAPKRFIEVLTLDMVELNEYEKKNAFYLKDVPLDRLHEITIIPFRPLPFPSEPEPESK